MPLRNLVSHHRIAADPYGVLGMLFHTERHSTSETVLQFIVTAVHMYCVTAYTAAVLTDSLMSSAPVLPYVRFRQNGLSYNMRSQCYA